MCSATMIVTPRTSLGFTLVELMTVMAVAAILMVIGIPQLEDFMADQHVRTVTSDLAADIALARVKAVEAAHRAHIQMTPGPNWTNGWRVYVDLNDSDGYVANVNGFAEQVKEFDGVSGTMRICTNVNDFATDVIFRPDGRVVRTIPPSPTDGIYVIDDMGRGNSAHTKIRGIVFELDGRAHVENLNPDNLVIVLPC